MNRPVAFVAAALLVACAPEVLPVAPSLAPPPPAVAPQVAPALPVVRATPDDPFRRSAPEGGPAVAFVAPTMRELHLRNGVRVLLVERHDLPVVAVRVVAKGGAGDLPWAPPGAASMMGSMLELGTTTRTALEISDAYEALGAMHAAWVDWDSGGAAIKVTTDKLDLALPVLADIVMHPSFQGEELDRLRARSLAAIQQAKSSAQAMGAAATAAALYGRGHAYGHALEGQAADVEKIDRTDLARVHAVVWSPLHASVVVAGDVTLEALAKKLDAVFGAWTPPEPPPLPSRVVPREVPPPAPVARRDAPRLVVVDKPGASQSVVRCAEVGVARAAPDHDAVALLNAIFGGMFSSRINLNLREVHGFTYGAHSRFDERHGAGPFVATATVKAESTAASIGELLKEVRTIRDDLVSPEELRRAKESLKQALPARFESVDAVTQALSDLVVYDLPIDEYATRAARIDRLTAEDVRKAARRHLHPRALRVIVVGDRSRVEPLLEPLHLGAPEVRDAYGDVAAAPLVRP
jgi:predicted Zn-dependent peptidase